MKTTFVTLPTILVGLAFLNACSSAPKVEKPAWISQPTRIVDNGYIVYVGTAEDSHPEQAQFKAEGQALEDLANECSFVPKGARIEDRYSEKEKYYTKSYVKVGLEFTECEKAKHANDPTAIKETANTSFTEQIRRYQDLVENGEAPTVEQYAALEVPKEVPPAPASTGMTESTHFYVTRQYIAYQKETVILAPPTAYAANSPESQHFTAAVQPAAAQVAQYQTKNPELAKQPVAWSKLPDRPKFPRPDVLRASAPTPQKEFKPMIAKHGRNSPAEKSSPRPQEGKKKKKKKHHL